MQPLEHNSNFILVDTLKETPEKTIRLFQNTRTQRYLLQRIVPESLLEVYQKIAELRHPNLIEIYDVSPWEGHTLVWEEYFDGIPLSTLLEDRTFSHKETKRLVLQLCNGLEALHSLQIIHRDIKPQNLLLSAEGLLKIIDYDASKAYKPLQLEDTSYLGTVGYAAPEQYGITQSDFRTDIFSFGILLNLLLTGEHPAVKLCTGKSRKIVEKCTRVNSAQRYQTVLELKKALLFL